MPGVRKNSAEKWTRRSASAGQEYSEGVANPRRPWEEATTAATASQAAGVQAAIARGAYAKGVRKAGNAKWSRKAMEVGPSRFAQGVTSATSDYQTGVAPYLQAIESTALPPRGPKGDPRNIQRVSAVNAALRKVKEQQG